MSPQACFSGSPAARRLVLVRSTSVAGIERTAQRSSAVVAAAGAGAAPPLHAAVADAPPASDPWLHGLPWTVPMRPGYACHRLRIEPRIPEWIRF